MLREIVFIFMALLIFMAFVLYDDNEFTVASKKTIYKTLNKNMEWAGIRKERNLDAFIQIHKRIIKGELPLKVHFNGIGGNGYGNRMYSVLTSFVVAILSDAAIFVSTWGPLIKSHIKEPFQMSFHDFGNETSVFNHKYLPDTVYSVAHGWGWDFNKNASRIINTETDWAPRYKEKAVGPNKWDHWYDPCNRTIYYGLEGEFFALCSNPKYYEKLYNYGLVEREVIDLAFERANNSKYTNEEQLRAVLQVGYDVGSTLLNKYWQYEDFLQERIDQLVESYFEDYYVIGFQMRTEFFDYDKGSRFFLECALDIERQWLLEDKNIKVKWFIASDHSDLARLINEVYFDKVILIEETGIDGESRRIIDIELLSRCNEMIITGSSTFGFLAAIKSGKLPYAIDAGWAEGVNLTSCKRTDLAHPPVRDFYIASFKK